MKSKPSDQDEIESWLKANRISEIECVFPDFSGSAKGKIIPAYKYIKEKGFSIPEMIFFQTITGNEPDNIENLVDSSESDMRLAPAIDNISLVPWAKDPTACIIHDCKRFDGSDVNIAPRNVLKKVLTYYKEKGWLPQVAPEIEFFLTQIETSPHNPLQPPLSRFKRPETGGNAYSMDTLNDFDPLLETLYQFCEAQNIEIDTLNHEFGTAQLEINLRHGDPLTIADNVFKFKRTCREAAIRHNMYATFMAKPLEGQPGSSMHVHQSILDKKTGKNIFVDSQNKYSKNFYYFIGGMQKYIPSLMIFFAPNVNSYRRFSPDWSAPTNVEWGFDNRTVGIRVPHSDADNTRIENRVAGSDTNPYLVFACTLAAGLSGIEEKIEPRQPSNKENYSDIDEFPKNLHDSILELEMPNNMHNMLGKDFLKAFKLVKTSEFSDYSKVISSWERKFLLLSV